MAALGQAIWADRRRVAAGVTVRPHRAKTAPIFCGFSRRGRQRHDGGPSVATFRAIKVWAIVSFAGQIGPKETVRTPLGCPLCAWRVALALARGRCR